MKKMISVIIISYNNWDYYKTCLDSVFTQDYPNIEIIFSDDGSNDFDKAEIEDYIKKNKGANIQKANVLYNKENLGTVKHLNKVIKMAKGDYIKTVAVDDSLYKEDVLSAAVGCLESTGSLVCMGYVDFYDELLETRIEQRPNKLEVDIIKRGEKKDLYKMVCISGKSLPVVGMIYSKRFFKEYGLYDEEYVLIEDVTKNAEAIKKGLKIQFIEQTIMKHRSGGVSTSNKVNQLYEKDKERFLLKEIQPNLSISLDAIKKDYVIWGTGSAYLNDSTKLSRIRFNYFVDSDVNKQGGKIDGKKVYPPEKLLQVNKDNVMIIICSSHFVEIENWLDSNGFKEKENYINMNLIESV